MTERVISRITGGCALAVVALSWGQFPLWMVGEPASIYDGDALARHLSGIANIALTRILFDQGIYVAMMIFAAGFRELVRRARPDCEWLGTLAFGSAVVWLAVTLVADGLEGGAVLDTLGGADPSAVRALVEGTIPIYNGSTAFAITGMFLAVAGWATLASGVLPAWSGWLAIVAAVLCVACVPAMYGGPIDYAGMYNAGGWLPVVVANFPPLLWFLVVGILFIRRVRPSPGMAEPLVTARTA
ncbi:MAG: hypothetical protein IT299_06510 [Dehalococcoidia bacterium]|nr:hypothetical protein [Dehalococcoidia bacterium]